MKAITWIQLPLGALLVVVGSMCVTSSRVISFSGSLSPLDIILCLLGLIFLAEGISKTLSALALTKRAESLRVKSAEDRLDELERLKRRDMITPEEYTAKRQEILKEL